MDRKFFSGQNACCNGCIYCFSAWQNDPLFPMLDENDLPKNTIIYPICDSEIAQQPKEFMQKLLTYAEKLDNSVVISISTKNDWTDEALDEINQFNKRNKAIIKLAVSFSSGISLSQTEPFASTYEQRLDLLRRITQKGMPTNVLLKPILPFISFEEYKQLINDCLKYTKYFVLGGLYVDLQSDFYKNYIMNKYPTKTKFCTWQNRNLEHVQHPDFDKITAYISINGAFAFESDKAFVNATLLKEGK